jgi:putative ABC transport system ATP-binding protein
MIIVNKLTKQYGKKESIFTALKEIDLKIKDGSTVAIIGKSGSGKSTLMHILSGLDRPTSGTLLIDDKELIKMKPKQIDSFRANYMGFIFQAFFVEANQTCYQNVLLPLEIAGVPTKKRDQLIKDALGKVDLLDKINIQAKNLSGGQKQRLAIARAIVNKPKLIFADEPTGNLDSVTGEKIIKLLFDLNKTIGSTLIIVTHDQDLANKCQTEFKLKDGQIINQREKS